jgi:hypothetical protein
LTVKSIDDNRKRYVQFHPLSDANHTRIDFLQLVPGNKVVVEIPVRVSGFSKGVQAGGKLMISHKEN